MLNTHKLLYLLPDVAYVCELLPTKKPHTFSVHSFRQINGEFMDDDEQLIVDNIAKLFTKLEQSEYHLILPDFLFTNTIINVSASSENKIASYIKQTLLPSLDLSSSSHYIETTKLTEFKGTAKIQLSALEKSLVLPLQISADEHKVTLTAISPLSWTIKSAISLEPSISVIQIGSRLYTAFHYIGVDQATISDTNDVEPVIETIRTLKGTEPSIQTIYLLSNSLIEEELKSKLSDIVPLQQLASYKDDNTSMPSYVQYIIEASMKTLSIPEFPVPQFALPKVTSEDRKAYLELLKTTPHTSSKTQNTTDEEDEDENDDWDNEEEAGKKETSTLPLTISEKQKDNQTAEMPKPSQPPVTPVAPAPVRLDLDDLESVGDNSSPEKNATPNVTIDDTPEETTDEDTTEYAITKTVSMTSEHRITNLEDNSKDELAKLVKNGENRGKNAEVEEVDLHQFAQTKTETISSIRNNANPEKKQTPIKNNNGVGSMLKMILITVAVFFTTVAVGIGVGMFVLNMAEQSDPNTQKTEESTLTPSPEVTAEPSPAPAATQSATPETTEVIDPATLSILVVNATTKAGYAGQFQKKLDDAKVGTTRAGNAKGTYEAGFHVLTKEANPALVAFLEKTLGLTLKTSTEQVTEDATSQYDAVVVLAQ